MSDFFNELMASVDEAVEISQGRKEPARVTRYAVPDVKAIRARTHMKQDDFAILIGVSSALVQAWEQGRRSPSGAALKLLKVLERKPDFVQVLREA
ncbi:helix-turn-helix domain-containing protein [Erwiniaceae bacterium BAC15a-03b]|uniref:Helix-turn-helix domain-containing protein n=1 Tax=Winslowiella arboricola TaxID=2978220 RepID=A0A9J6PST0_9GAMM|nr:NadS family protein [Winslowiella arboricola]MCU5772448.1 helix-turn-helix domain-containing protein [Winslowiella arboricola]MCU5779758.1 helix-turn-helix domain-containing protein [Winslowiella arboricola]